MLTSNWYVFTAALAGMKKNPAKHKKGSKEAAQQKLFVFAIFELKPIVPVCNVKYVWCDMTGARSSGFISGWEEYEIKYQFVRWPEGRCCQH